MILGINTRPGGAFSVLLHLEGGKGESGGWGKRKMKTNITVSNLMSTNFWFLLNFRFILTPTDDSFLT